MKNTAVDTNVSHRAQSLLSQGIPFCLVNLPHSREIRLFSSAQCKQPNQGPYLMVQDWGNQDTCYFSNQDSDCALEATQGFDIPRASTFEDYSLQFSKFQKAFADQGIRKAILSRVINEVRPEGFDPIEAFAKLCETRTDTFNYLLLHPSKGLWMGASPEILLHKHKTHGQTMSLAGTQTISKTAYTWGEKELEEQALVSEHIRNVLMQTPITALTERGPMNSEAGNVVHLKTTFDFEFKPESKPIELANKLHPTPAISGLPVGEATVLINQTETHKRLLYTGFLGLIEDKEIDLFVNLRCMQIHDRLISIYVGGGITQKSVCEDEWKETEAKAQTMKKIIHA